ncbi:uncharacterized protein LOC109712621 isoform X1 [Ananas comosus]|uniref:Uncharacterized protein LOC109712621 isoform X1 n=1 Tax=Ananas comosus TaxID=4615 RepID=A0A6P5F8E8_ANACO|nr:uncharacterized protein LOC109712621 isoform X1 [Ananas comosus]
MALSSGSWRASTNWDAGEGSLEGSISFETSADDAPASSSSSSSPSPSPSPAGALLLRPNSDDPPPCEITIYFQEKHEIHTLYVKSTARVYEIYYAADLKYGGKEYLATVRCGPAAEEVPSSSEGKIAEGKHENIVQSDSTTSDEDGWVEVKLPDSPLQSNGFSRANNQMHYEATAEISDASPCISLTLRLLSLETKASVHVEEIYIYADPVESLTEDSPAVTAGSAGSSILAMLVPNLLQLSKSVRPSSSYAMSTRIEPHFDLEDLNIRSVQDQANTKHVDGHSKSIQVLNDQESYSMENQDLGPMQVESKVNPENVPSESCQKAIDSDQATNCVTKEDTLAHSRIENMVNDLLCKVGRIESCCSRLEENMMKPLSCIETRLRRLEEKFDAFQMEIESLKEVAETPPSASSIEKSNLENKAWKSSCTEGDVCDMSPGLVVKAPDFSIEELYDSQLQDNDVSHCGHESKTSPGLIIKAPEFPSEELLDTADNVAASEEEFKMCQGLVVKAPEFPSENEDCTNNNDNQEKSVMNNSGHKKPLSIDGALASALAAFLTSSGVPSRNSSPCVVDLPHKFPADSDYNSDSLVFPEGAGNISTTSFSDEQTARVSAEVKDEEAAFYASPLPANVEAVPDCSLNKSDFDNKNCCESDEAKKDSTFDSSGLACDLCSFVPLHHSSSCLIVPMLDYSKHEFIDLCGASDTDENPDTQLTLALAKFLSSRKVDSSSHKSTMLDYPELFTAEKTQFGVEKSDSGSSGNNVKEHGELNLKFEQNGNGASYLIAGKADVKQLPMHNVLRPIDVCSDEGEENTWRGGLSFKTSDAEEAASEGPYMNRFARVWIEDSSSDSSFDENFIRSKVEVYLSDGSSTDSMMHSSSQFADIFGTGEPSIRNSVNQDCGVEREIGDSQKAFNLNLNFEDSTLDVNFTPVRKSDGNFPLQAWLSRISNCKEQDSVYGDGDRVVSADGLANSSSSPRVGSLAINQCLVDVEDLPTPSETCAGGSNFEQFSSLI